MNERRQFLRNILRTNPRFFAGSLVSVVQESASRTGGANGEVFPTSANTKINTERIAALKPCAKRFENFKREYPDFDGDILEFLSLEKITSNDKIWVAIRVLPREILEVFAIDCAFSASEYAVANYDAAEYATAYATNCIAADAVDYAAAAANYAANYTAAAAAAADHAIHAYDAERERQVNALIYLIESEEK
jgi:hypothetical protein